MKYCFVAVLFALLSCNGQKKMVSTSTMVGPSEQSNGLELLLQEEYSGFDTEETMIIKDRKNLKSFYSKLNRTRKPGLPVPEVDFTKNMVVVQCSGEQQHMGAPILTFDKETDSAIVLTSKLVRDKKSGSKTITTFPFCLYKMPLTDKEIVVKSPKNQG